MLCCEWYSDSRLNIPLSCSSVANLVVLFCGIMELLAEMNGHLTERRETEFVEKRRKKTPTVLNRLVSSVDGVCSLFIVFLFQNNMV